VVVQKLKVGQAFVYNLFASAPMRVILEGLFRAANDLIMSTNISTYARVPIVDCVMPRRVSLLVFG
jgi:methylmalonyl-CoA mutase cobalamin-binding subunit